MGFFSKKDKDAYGEYANDIFEENYALSDEGILPIGQRQDINYSTYALTPDEVKGNLPAEPVDNTPKISAGESLYQRMMEAKNNTKEAEKKSEEVKEQAESLLSRCSQFVSDDKGNLATDNTPLYTLVSVEEIIAEAEKRAQDRVKKLYGTEPVANDSPANDEKIKNIEIKETIEEPKEVKEEITESPVAESPATDPDIDATREIVLPVTDALDGATVEIPKIAPETIAMSKEPDVKSYQFRFADEDRESAPLEEETEEGIDGSTISFVPVKDTTTSLADEVRASLEMVDISSGKKEELTDAEEEYFGDYESIDDAAEIRKKLRKRHNKLRARTLLSLVPALILLVLSLPFFSATKNENAFSFMVFEVILTAISLLINLDVLKSLGAVFGKKANADLPLAIFTLATLAFGIYCCVTSTITAQYGIVAAIGLLASAHYKRRSAKRVLKNFEQIANSDEKFAVTLINEENGSYAIAHDAVEGEALVAAGKKTVNIHHFLKNSYSDDPFAPTATILSIIGLIVSLGMLVYGSVTSTVFDGIISMLAMLAICAPFSAKIIGNVPLYLASLRLSKYGAMLSGHTAVEEVEPANAVVFDIGSIFPRGTVKMYDMKILSPNNLDQTIFNAAAVCTSIGSPLGHVFRRIARTSDDYVLPPADSVKYENRLGISGWVGDFSLLIGNRTLMETHGVPVPSVEVDKKILRNGYFPVYVASNGHPCALLIVGYEGRDDITNELHRLCNSGVTLLINNCDPNVTEDMLCDYFGLPDGFVKLMQNGSIRKYEENTEFSESCVAGASYNGSACGLASAVTAAIKTKKLTTAMTVMHIIFQFLGIAAAIVLTVLGNKELLNPLYIAAYLAVSAFFVRICAIFSKP